MRRHITIIAVFFALVVPSGTGAQAEECLNIVSDPKTVRVAALVSGSVKKVFEKAGICARFNTLPVRRIQESMIKGTIDGEFLRVNSYIKTMSDYIVRIPTPALKAEAVIISRSDGQFKPANITDIKEYVIGIMHGYKYHEVFAKRVKNTFSSNKYVFLLKMLRAGRIDGILIDTVTLGRMEQKGVVSSKEIYKSPGIINLSAYILLNKKHENMVGKLDAAMKTVIAEGGFSLKQ